MTTKKYIYIITIAFSSLLINSCNKSEKVENPDTTEEVSSTETIASTENETVSDETKSNIETVSSSDSNIDKMLDDYEEYVDKYIVYAKKIQAGDTSMMKEYTEIMGKAIDYGESMEKIKEDEEITPAQMKRMMEIQTKMAGAISVPK